MEGCQEGAHWQHVTNSRVFQCLHRTLKRGDNLRDGSTDRLFIMNGHHAPAFASRIRWEDYKRLRIPHDACTSSQWRLLRGGDVEVEVEDQEALQNDVRKLPKTTIIIMIIAEEGGRAVIISSPGSDGDHRSKIPAGASQSSTSWTTRYLLLLLYCSRPVQLD
eukprot:scaffold9796_cov154-Ochromonas_danica.AAC.4